MNDRAFVLGAGRAGRGLARALRASGVELVALHGRRDEDAPDRVSAGDMRAALRLADVVFVAVRDAQIDPALDELVAAGLEPDVIVLHLSGSAEPAGLVRLRQRGNACGTFHPLLPLARAERAPELFRAGWVGVDGDDRAREAAKRLAARLGARVLEIPRGGKALYHAAAVVASNLTVVLAGEAERVMRAAGVDPERARAAVGTLFAAAAANVLADGAAALTGPLARGEAATIRQHLDALRGHPTALASYVAVSLAAAPAGSDIARILEGESARSGSGLA